MSEISDKADDRLEAARIAPSSMNNQPWHFNHAGEEIEVRCKKQDGKRRIYPDGQNPL